MEVLEFVVPVENNKALFVWNIEPSLTEAQIHLLSVFSAFGPLYLVKVFPNAPLHPPGFYALIKFYSAVQAAEAQRLTDGKTLFQSSQLKVKLSSKQTPAFMSGSSTPLSHTHCLELANHCLGFNGWTSEIITVRNTAVIGWLRYEGDGGGVRRLRMGCLLQLCFPQHLRSSRGAAVVEDTFSCTGNTMCSVGISFVAIFWNLLIISVESVFVFVEGCFLWHRAQLTEATDMLRNVSWHQYFANVNLTCKIYDDLS
uniref:RAD52 motif-containing protein 1 n=1 Tax=Acanthochromis polyacanthus TaxID=80966 RepID=A0A3Q1GRG7_9TELE